MFRHFLFLFPLFGCFVGASQDYFQQKVDYNINVRLNDEDHTLDGDVTFQYLNNSPDTLDFIIIHLWPNAYRNSKTALGKQLIEMGNTELFYAKEEDRGYIDELSFSVDNKPGVWEYDSVHIDICTLKLAQPLLPGGSVKVSTPFHVKLPSGSISRLGHIGESYQITQWYPKPAVYDREGWHGMPYLTQGEFFSEYGSFDVSITLPSNYSVGATGDLQTKSEIERMDDLARKTAKWIRTDDLSDLSNDFPESDSVFKTIRFVQSNVHDFAWFADKRYRILKGSVQLPESQDSVVLWTMFTEKSARLWKESIEYMHDAVYYYSLWNGDYPYKQATAVDGTISAGGGMEYPNVTVIGGAANPYLLETVIMHEVGHNWFYGILGSNERRYAWMDEGLNSYNEQRYFSTKYPDGKLLSTGEPGSLIKFAGFDRYDIEDQHYLIYLISARANNDQELNLHSAQYSNLNYGSIVYSKSAVYFNYLRNYLGDERMDQAMHEYFDAFKFKHPYPEDFERIVESSSGEDLDWMFNDVINKTAKLDYSINRVKRSDDATKITLKNRRGIAGPVLIGLHSESSDSAFWIQGFNRDTTITVNQYFDEVRIDPEWIMPEVNRKNNNSRAKGILKKRDPIQLKFLGQAENPDRTEVFFAPILGANVPSGWMPGVAFYNSIIPVKKFNYLIAPMYSTKGAEPVGFLNMYYMFTPQASSFESFDLGVQAKRYFKKTIPPTPFLTYARIEPYLTINFRPPSYHGLWHHWLKISSVTVLDDSVDVQTNDLGTEIQITTKTSTEVYNRITYHVDYDHPIHESFLEFRGEQYEDFIRTSLELVNRTTIAKVLKVYSRVFGGVFVSNNSTDARFNWRMDGQNGRTDYAYDGTFLDRSFADNLLSRQMSMTHGGFATPMATGQSSLGLASYNMRATVKKFPIGVFADLGYAFDGDFSADAGLALSMLKNHFNVYLPLAFTDNIQKEITANKLETLDLIRFQIDFNAMDLMELRRHLRL